MVGVMYRWWANGSKDSHAVTAMSAARDSAWEVQRWARQRNWLA